jgi:hypothetical protein
MSNLWEMFKGWFRPTLDSLDEENYDDFFHRTKKVNDLKVGQSFKGHSTSLFTDNSRTTKSIQYNNNYYMGGVQCIYEVEADKTRINIRNMTRTPKYISNSISSNSHVEAKFEYKECMYIVYIDNHSLNITKEMVMEGIQFFNHFENINMIKETRVLLDKIRHIFKHEDLNKHLIPDGTDRFKLKII